ncbi:MAG TPA: hypothetical protein VEJ63_11825 [Planctomycetota bacterium]|nr:hypothetical protein [Planctomycetota bacterium]
MTDKARKFWQLHLTTLLAAVLAYAAFLTLEIVFNSQIEDGLKSLLKADAVAASDASPFPEIPLLPLYLAVDLIAAASCAVLVECVLRRRSAG